jgi:phosphohistidine phosphatase
VPKPAERKTRTPRTPARAAKRAPRLRVLAIRHAIAVEREDFARDGGTDALRPLTRTGRRKMRRAAEGLAMLVPKLDALAASPLTRAAQTADILARRYKGVRTLSLAPLAPGRAGAALIGWLDEQKPGGTVAIVGHEPDLGQFVSWALTGLRESFIPLKKGGACLIEFERDVKPGRAKLLWCLRPSQLRGLKP